MGLFIHVEADMYKNTDFFERMTAQLPEGIVMYGCHVKRFYMMRSSCKKNEKFFT